MNQTQFDALMLLGKTLGIIAGAIVGWAKYMKYLEVKATEKSVGAKKVKELEEQVENVRREIKTLSGDRENDKSQMSKLQRDYEKLIEHIWDLLNRK